MVKDTQHPRPSFKVISSEHTPATIAKIAAFEFAAIHDFAAMSQEDRQRRGKEIAEQVRVMALLGLELLSMDKAAVIARVRDRYDVLSPWLMDLAHARESAEMLREIISSAECRLAVALAVVEGDDEDQDT
jgi:hypothetical protein